MRNYNRLDILSLMIIDDLKLLSPCVGYPWSCVLPQEIFICLEVNNPNLSTKLTAQQPIPPSVLPPLSYNKNILQLINQYFCLNAVLPFNTRDIPKHLRIT